MGRSAGQYPGVNLIGAFRGEPKSPAYGASKAGIVEFTDAERASGTVPNYNGTPYLRM